MEVITDTKSHLAARAGGAITEVAEKHADAPLLLLFSGGSALSIIEHIDPTNFAGRATLGVLDERIGVSDEDSNMAQLEATEFFDKAISAGAAAIDPREIESEAVEETAAWFETILRAWHENNTGGLVIVTQGIGEDGHTAGIMPGEEESFAQTFDNTNRWTVGYQPPSEKSKFPKRVTVTMPFLRDVVTSSIVYVPGENKKEIIQQVINTPSDPLCEYPARIIHQMNDVMIFSDQSLETPSRET